MRTDPSKYIPTSADTAEQWIEWHKSLKKWFNKNLANQYWLQFWNQRAGAGSSADTHTLRKYMDGEGVDLTTTATGEMADVALGALEWGAETMNWIRGIILGGVILAMGLIAYYIIQNTRKGKTMGEMTSGIRSGGKVLMGGTQLRLE